MYNVLQSQTQVPNLNNLFSCTPMLVDSVAKNYCKTKNIRQPQIIITAFVVSTMRHLKCYSARKLLILVKHHEIYMFIIKMPRCYIIWSRFICLATNYKKSATSCIWLSILKFANISVFLCIVTTESNKGLWVILWVI